MIEFKIIACPDKSQLASYQHMGKELTLGKTEGDMIVDDPAFGNLQIKIVLNDDKSATLENLNIGTDVRLNGKSISGVVPLKEKDNITVARTTINISKLDLSPPPTPQPYEHPNARERFTPGSKESTVLEVLDFLEKNYSTGGASPPIPGTPGAKPPVPGAKPPLPPGMPAAKPPVPPTPKKN